MINRKQLFVGLTGGVIGFLSIVMVVAIAMLMLASSPDDVHASRSEGGRWTFTLYDYSTTSLVNVYEDGTEERVTLQLVEGESIDYLALAPAGINRAAFCGMVVTDPNNPSEASARLAIFDTTNGQRTQQVDLGKTTACRVSPTGFSPDGNTVSVGMVNFDAEQDASALTWRLVLVDVASGQVVKELNALSPESSIVDTDAAHRFFTMPDVRRYEDGVLYFALMAWATEGIPTENAFQWNLNDNTLTRHTEWGQLQYDYLANTGEMVWVEQDDTLPAGNPGGPIPTYNVVRIREANGDVNTLFTSAEYLPIDVQFIDNGQAIGILLLQSFNENEIPDGSQQSKWIRLDRNGSITDLRDTTGKFSLLLPFRDTHAWYLQDYQPSQRAFFEIGEDGTVLWESPLTSYSFLTSSPLQVDPSGLAPFQPIQ